MDLNIRDVPAAIMRSLRVDAAAEGITIKDLCLRRLVPDGGKSWEPQTVQGKPIQEPIRELPKPATKVKKSVVVVKPDPLQELIELAASGEDEAEEPKCRACKFVLRAWQGGKACPNSQCQKWHMLVTP